ncbi:MAG: hypothetical protein AAGG01_22585, partial [Planctomycetota bacterium]
MARIPAPLVPLALLLAAVLPSHADGQGAAKPADRKAEAQAILSQARGELRLLNRMNRAIPRSPLTPQAFAKERSGNGLTLAANAVQWFAENVRWLPYRGVLRGSFGTLLERRANALDQAVTLAAALESRGLEARIANMALSEETASALHAGLLLADRAQEAAEKASADGAGPDAQALALFKACGLDPKEFEAPYAEAQARGQEWLEDVLPTTIRQADELRAVLAKSGGVTAATEDLLAREIGILRDHFWVQARDPKGAQDAWTDLDPLAIRGAIEVEHSPVASFATDAIPADLEHSLVVRVIARRSGVEGSTTQAALEQPYLTRDL